VEDSIEGGAANLLFENDILRCLTDAFDAGTLRWEPFCRVVGGATPYRRHSALSWTCEHKKLYEASTCAHSTR
jgi:hypothetical protein